MTRRQFLQLLLVSLAAAFVPKPKPKPEPQVDCPGATKFIPEPYWKMAILRSNGSVAWTINLEADHPTWIEVEGVAPHDNLDIVFNRRASD